jgi:nucleotide-binding universal stress UspA family protein
MERIMFKHILVPTDGSDITAKAISTALALAKSVGAQLHTISAKEPFPYSAISEMQPTPPQEFFDAQERIASQRVAAVVTLCNEAGVTCHAHTVEALHPWEAIIDHARRMECDLIVMASHGRRGVSALLLGSETQKVLTHTKVPVLVVR